MATCKNDFDNWTQLKKGDVIYVPFTYIGEDEWDDETVAFTAPDGEYYELSKDEVDALLNPKETLTKQLKEVQKKAAEIKKQLSALEE